MAIKRSAASSKKTVTHDERIAANIADAAKRAGASATQQSAKVDYYYIIDFGYVAGQPFVPNSVQFYSNTSGFLCYKLIDNASLVSLVPILNCPTIYVTWNTATNEAVHIYGKKP